MKWTLPLWSMPSGFSSVRIPIAWQWLLTCALLVLGVSTLPASSSSKRQQPISPTPSASLTSDPSVIDALLGNTSASNNIAVISLVGGAVAGLLQLVLKVVKLTFDYLLRRRAQQERALRRAAAATVTPPSPPHQHQHQHQQHVAADQLPTTNHITVVNVSPPHSRTHSRRHSPPHHHDVEMGLRDE